MTVNAILKHKGSDVVTIDRSETVTRAVAMLAEKRIGAVLVTEAGHDRVIGVFSERDLVRGIALRGASCLEVRVDELMTTDIVSCRPEDSIPAVMGLMTERRIRHLPVLRDGELVGIVSIGDIVKSRILEIESETSALRSYIATG